MRVSLEEWRAEEKVLREVGNFVPRRAVEKNRTVVEWTVKSVNDDARLLARFDIVSVS